MPSNCRRPQSFIIGTPRVTSQVDSGASVGGKHRPSSPTTIMGSGCSYRRTAPVGNPGRAWRPRLAGKSVRPARRPWSEAVRDGPMIAAFNANRRRRQSSPLETSCPNVCVSARSTASAARLKASSPPFAANSSRFRCARRCMPRKSRPISSIKSGVSRPSSRSISRAGAQDKRTPLSRSQARWMLRERAPAETANRKTKARSPRCSLRRSWLPLAPE